MARTLILLVALSLAGCTPALVRKCEGNAFRYSDETSAKYKDFEMHYKVEWQCLPLANPDRSK